MAATNSAPNRRYNTASDPITTISESALLMGCFCSRRFTAAATHTPPKMRNSTRCSMSSRSRDQRHNQTGNDDVCNGERQQKLPPKGHQLVITEAWQRAPHPNVNKNKKEHLQAEPKNRGQCLQNWRQRVRHRPMPSAETKQRCLRSHG